MGKQLSFIRSSAIENRQLTECGWLVQSRSEIKLSGERAGGRRGRRSWSFRLSAALLITRFCRPSTVLRCGGKAKERRSLVLEPSRTLHQRHTRTTHPSGRAGSVLLRCLQHRSSLTRSQGPNPGFAPRVRLKATPSVHTLGFFGCNFVPNTLTRFDPAADPLPPPPAQRAVDPRGRR